MNQYPLWRYILLVVLIVLGVLYALPSLYGEDYAIQVTAKNNQTVTAQLEQKIQQNLQQQKIPFISMAISDDQHSVLIRFQEAAQQLKAQDVVEATVGNQFTVALNLAPRTPAWLQAIGAKPLKLGLDLRGGVHFLLDVDVNAMVKETEAGDVRQMGDMLRENNIRYTQLNQNNGNISIDFRDANAMNAANSLFAKRFSNYTLTTTTKNGQYILTARMLPEAIIQLQDYAVNQNINILNNRVNELGVSEALVQRQGANQINVDLPGVQDMARAKSLIGNVATVRFQMVDTDHDANQAAAGVVPFGSQLFYFEGRPLLLKNQVVLKGSSIVNASAVLGDDGRPAVNVRLGQGNVSYFNRITGENIGKPMATVYVQTISDKKMVNGKPVTIHRKEAKIISVANIQSALGNNFQIMGLDSMRYAQNLALQLRSGAYSAPLDFVQERLIGPSLGKANIDMGVRSTVIGALLVFIFMLFYYRLFGLFADLALFLNLVFIIAIMAIMDATMTLPGIAALVLTLGMAVDANVLINERIREELRNGVSPQASIYAGYERAFSTIVDANVTTLIVAIVLFALGSQSVKGFAVTLTIGLLTSMVTAIFFTRALVNLVYGRKHHLKQISIGITVKRESVNRLQDKGA